MKATVPARATAAAVLSPIRLARVGCLLALGGVYAWLFLDVSAVVNADALEVVSGLVVIAALGVAFAVAAGQFSLDANGAFAPIGALLLCWWPLLLFTLVSLNPAADQVAQTRARRALPRVLAAEHVLLTRTGRETSSPQTLESVDPSLSRVARAEQMILSVDPNSTIPVSGYVLTVTVDGPLMSVGSATGQLPVPRTGASIASH